MRNCNFVHKFIDFSRYYHSVIYFILIDTDFPFYNKNVFFLRYPKSNLPYTMSS